jgi:hypothetical protein
VTLGFPLFAAAQQGEEIADLPEVPKLVGVQLVRDRADRPIRDVEREQRVVHRGA